ncbi:MAG TPA: hypothetical protein VN361_03420 [Oxalicibacterium sp.]|nr:hypothetical protein [Oxalicibacterium sp.]
MNKLLCALMLAATASIACPALAQPDTSNAKQTPAPKKTVKKTMKKKKATKAAAAAAPAVIAAGDDEDDDAPMSLEGSTTIDFDCELGNKITIYTNPNDDKHIAIRWKNQLHRLRRIATTTGANRFENRKYGLVWINIPAKAMLLDSKKGQQLANECRDPEQAKLFAQKK